LNAPQAQPDRCEPWRAVIHRSYRSKTSSLIDGLQTESRPGMVVPKFPLTVLMYVPEPLTPPH
jgi:hypothetical protein